VAVAVLDRERELFHSVALASDAYTQERLLALDLIGRAQPGELWIGDRNFCTSAILWQLNYVGAKFLIRRHASNVRFETVGRRKHFGQTDSGLVYEQSVRIVDDHDQSMKARLIRLELTKPTRDGDHAIELLTNLPERYIPMRIADAYRKRWQIETNFAHVEKLFDGEIPTRSDPRAALLAFCLALIAWHAVALLKAALRKKHGGKPINEELSMYYLADTILRHSQGMNIFEVELDWAKRFAMLTPRQLARALTHLAISVDLTRLKKNIRSPKKRLPKPKAKKNRPHFSTARVLQAAT
jgi:hypothetical protein